MLRSGKIIATILFVGNCRTAPNDNAHMKTPPRLQSLLDEGLIDSVVRQLMSGKEAMVYVVRCGDETRCAKIYKEATNRSFRQAVDYTENRKVKNSRQAPIKGASRKGEGSGRCEEGVLRITSAGAKDSSFSALSCDRIEVVVTGQGRVQITAINARTVALRTGGAGEITVGLLTADTLHARNGGDGPITIRDGHVISTKLVLSGTGEFDAQGLVSDSADIAHSAPSAARMNVTRSLTGSLSGSGELRHTGGAIVRVSNSGSGRVTGL